MYYYLSYFVFIYIYIYKTIQVRYNVIWKLRKIKMNVMRKSCYFVYIYNVYATRLRTYNYMSK